ncbi:hypothetical protein GALMADRAFT_231894 [Galerina marginata CBS 339.88]|uniref:Uncharacterized protein n=1 Tax=Galerina marginata (strain CBS 339.88) TaxID=685588 RepID=A0A067SLR8_GALM3|nr:hypothetical protein GALMADRAFT_231894 [Galerina marginata CBS 339.88]
MQPNLNRGLNPPQNTRGGRGAGGDGQIQQGEHTGAPSSRSLIPVRPSGGLTRGRGRAIPQVIASPRHASMLQSASQVDISGGNFNAIGANQFNFTINCMFLNI